MQQSWLISGVIGVCAALIPGVGTATPIAIAVGSIKSVGGEQGFCPSENLQKAVMQVLSRNPAYSVQVESLDGSSVEVKVSGDANCSLSLRQYQNGFLIFQQPSTVMTATVDLQLQLTNGSTGNTIATFREQGKAQSETRSQPIKSFSPEAESKADPLFAQAIAQALDTMLPQVNTALERRNF